MSTGPQGVDAFAPGQLIKEYQLVQKLGSGGMAEVWVAQRSGPAGFRKRVVIKRILEHLSQESEALSMFLDEARLAATLHHSQIVRIHELLEADDNYLIVMEYIPGRSLRDVVRRLRDRKLRMSPEAVATCASRVCEGLDYAHNALDHAGSPMHLVHRDVTPQNVLLTASGHVKIIDFGIARGASRIARTGNGVLKGTPYYMAPEQTRGEDVDGRADVYALGSTMYELVTGRRPFAGNDIHAALVKAASGERPLHPKEQRESVPDALADIIWKAMDPEPAGRYQSATEFQGALDEWLLTRPGGALDARRLSKILESLFPEGVDPVPPAPGDRPELPQVLRDSAPRPSSPSAPLPSVPQAASVPSSEEVEDPMPAEPAPEPARPVISRAMLSGRYRVGGAQARNNGNGHRPSGTYSRPNPVPSSPSGTFDPELGTTVLPDCSYITVSNQRKVDHDETEVSQPLPAIRSARRPEEETAEPIEARRGWRRLIPLLSRLAMLLMAASMGALLGALATAQWSDEPGEATVEMSYKQFTSNQEPLPPDP